MNHNHNSSAEINQIVVGEGAGNWLKHRDLLPSLWNLPKAEPERILKSGIRLAIIY
jgi:hypothetical protein